MDENWKLKGQGYHFFGATLSFIATRSGLLRWQDLGDETSNGPHFSEINRRSIDEVWYKRAVEQHRIEPESFVYSVPYDDGLRGKPLVTATHAVFVEHKGHRAPAAVVGIQYQQATLAAHFINITSSCSSPCKKTCASDELDCYVLDNNGFIILSETPEEAGRFFGQVDGTIMDSLVQDRIFKRVAVYDYQGACSDEDSPYSAAPAGRRAPTVASVARLLLEWLLAHAAWMGVHTQIGAILSDTWGAAARILREYPNFAEPDDYDSEGDDEDEGVGVDDEDTDDEDESDDGTGDSEDVVDPYGGSSHAGGSSHGDVSNNVDPDRGYGGRHNNYHLPDELDRNDWIGQADTEDSDPGWHMFKVPEPATPPAPPPPPVDEHEEESIMEEQSPPPSPPKPAPPPPSLNMTRARPCDKRVDLYVLQPERLNSSDPLKGKLTNCHATGCERPFSVQRIQHSNLILLVVDTLCPCGSKQLPIQSEEVTYDGSCNRRHPRDNLQRRRPPKCISYHPEEIEIHECGSARAWTASWTLVALASLTWLPWVTS